MINHLPILQVIIPLLAAPISVILGRARLVWLFTLLVSAISLLVSVGLLFQVMQQGPISYELGGWAPPWGIEYRVDALNAFVLLIVTGISTIVLLAADTSIQKEIPAGRQTLFYVNYLLCLAGLLGITVTGDAFNVFVFLEVSSLSTYTLIALGQNRRALWASYQYLIMGTIGASFILIGIGFMYMVTGTLNMQDLATRLPEVEDTRTVYTAFAFFIVGVCLKLALFPLHLWLPNAYTYAPSIATAFLAATATKVAIYVLIRFVFSVFGVEFTFDHIPMQTVFVVLGLLGIFIASIVAIYQADAKRLFAYSSVAQIGYMIVGFGLGTPEGVMAAVLHLFNHALMKGALFMALAAIVYRLGSVKFADLQGVGRTMPWTSAAMVVGGLSLIGVPLTAGFVSKWYLVLAAFDSGWWPIAVAVLLGSLLAIIYVWRFVESAYFKPATDQVKAATEAPLMILIPTWLLVIGNIYFGLDTSLTVGVTEVAIDSLYGVAP